MLTSLATADDVKDWLSKPASKAAYTEFKKTIKPRLICAHTTLVGKKREFVKREIVHFLQDY